MDLVIIVDHQMAMRSTLTTVIVLSVILINSEEPVDWDVMEGSPGYVMFVTPFSVCSL